MTLQIFCYFLVGLALQVKGQHLPLQIAKDLVHLVFNIVVLFAVDHQLFRIGDLGA